MFSTIGRRRVAVVLFLALFVAWGIVALGLAQRLQSAAAAPPAERRAAVVVAARDLPDRTRLTAADVRVVQIPASARHKNAASTIDQVVNRVLIRPAFASEPLLLPALISMKGGTGLALRVPDGLRAIAVSFSEVIGAGGLIAPGDSVDVIAVFDDGVRGAHEAGYVLQDVKVLAVAQSLAVSPSESSDDKRRDQIAAAKTATLAVGPLDAERLALAERFGTLKLILRAPDNQDRPTAPPVRASEIFLDESAPNVTNVPPTVLRTEPRLHAADR